jgi:hypothetical protein
MTRLEDQAAGFAHHSQKRDSEATPLDLQPGYTRAGPCDRCMLSARRFHEPDERTDRGRHLQRDVGSLPARQVTPRDS